MARQVKSPASSLQWLGKLLWRGFDRCLRNFNMPWARPKKKNNQVGPSKDSSVIEDIWAETLRQ